MKSGKQMDASSQSNFLQSVNNTLKHPLEISLNLLNKSDDFKHKKEIEAQIGQVDKNLQSMLILNQVRESNLESNKVDVNPIEFLEKVIFAHTSTAIDNKIDFYVYIDTDLPKRIEIDTKQVQYILDTLIGNAIKHTNKGGSVYVDIRTKKHTDNRIEIIYTVSDTGVGIAQTALKKILQPFATQSTEGLGIGLSSCYHLLKQKGSPLKIASQEGKGSRFYFRELYKTSNEPSFDLLPNVKIGVYVEDRGLFGHAKVLYQYLISMGLSVVSVKDINDKAIRDCQAVFMVTSSLDNYKKVKDSLKDTSVFPAILDILNETFASVENRLLFPCSSRPLYALLEKMNKNNLQDAVVSNEKDKQAIQDLAELAKEEKVSILVVEDNAINLKLVKVILSRYDFEIDTAENGQIAVDQCKVKKYNLILMDIDMPVMDGITATNTIKAYEKEEGLEKTPIVALTSHDLVGEREEIMSKGLDEHMPKPLNVGRLELMLERYIGYTHKA